MHRSMSDPTDGPAAAVPPLPEPVMTHGLAFYWLGRLSYRDGLELQELLAERRLRGAVPDSVLLLEHEPVYTIGRTQDKTSLRNPAALPHPVVEISRGGQATYHGPGQLVGYPVLDLTRRGRDLHRYLRALEMALLGLCFRLGLQAERREALTGVWTGERKLASIGVGVRHWITRHGFALNVTPESLVGFTSITPCGLTGVAMTCLCHETGRSLTVEEIAAAVREPLGHALATLADHAEL